jgi:hypothetical protein
MRNFTDEEYELLYKIRPYIDKYGNLKPDAPEEIVEMLNKLLELSADNVCY